MMSGAHCFARLWLLCATLLVPTSVALATDFEMPIVDPQYSIRVSAREAQRWQQGMYEVWHLREFELRQEKAVARAREAIIWVYRQPAGQGTASHVIVYLEGSAQVTFAGKSFGQQTPGRPPGLQGPNWLGRFRTAREVRIEPRSTIRAQTIPEIFERAMEARRLDGSAYHPVSQTEDGDARETVIEGGNRSISIIPKNRVFQVEDHSDPNSNESMMTLTGGIRVTIENAQVQDHNLGAIRIEADNVVIWRPAGTLKDLRGVTPRELPIDLYLEGNIVVWQGGRVIYADRMYYSVKDEKGVILNAEMLTPVEEYQGLMRLKADVLEQVNGQNFMAYGGALTSSRMGYPSYWIQSQNIHVRDIQTPMMDLTGQPLIDRNGQPQTEHNFLARSKNNFVYAGGVPIFYWPAITTNLQKPSYYVDRLQIRNDSVFGTQVLLDLDMFQLLNREAWDGTDWTVSLDGLTERGFGTGTHMEYDRFGIFGLSGNTTGMLDSWVIREQGVDNLGADRRGLIPEEDLRGRIFWQHRQELLSGLLLQAEVGLISDRNFLEQYYEREWDEWKDQSTRLELKRYNGNRSFSLSGAVRLNDFFTETEWLPRFDHYWLGQSLFQRLTWFGHTHAGFARLKTASSPLDPTDLAKFQPLAWETPTNTFRVATRHELDLPLEWGPMKVVPFALGEVAYWSNDVDQERATRFIAQGGVRTALPMWRADNNVQSELFNLNGLAHKVLWKSEFLYADVSEDMTRLPLLDKLDDNNTEHFRRRYHFDTFGGTTGTNLPIKFDERFFAARSGMQRFVTAPSTEIAEDQLQARFGIEQRWQTKRGLPGQQRIVDWMVLDVEGTLFGDPNRDNFGQQLGLLDYQFRWHVGDRVTVLSDGFADFFGSGLRTVSLGAVMSRPGHSTTYVGYRSIEGPFSSNIINAALTYRMSEKWIAQAGTSFDLGRTGNIGQSLGLIRIGESALVRVGFNFDESRNNVGIHFTIEPRFLPNARLSRIAGVQLPPAGVFGVE